MIRIWLVLSVIAGLVISGCASAPENENEFDWCYIYHLNEPIGFEFEAGSVTGQGLTSDASGVLLASYEYDRDVYNRVAYITIMRPAGAVGDITVKAVAEIFSVSYTTFGTTLPDGVDTAVIETREGAFTEIQVSRDSMSVHAETTTGQQISVAQIEVRGDGASPFPHNYCDDSTPTHTPPGPGIPTYTPSPSITPTITPTVTGTLSPTPVTAVCEWDFTTFYGEDTIANVAYVYHPGQGLGPGTVSIRISQLFYIPGTITRATFTFAGALSGVAQLYTSGSVLVSSPTGSGTVWDFTGLSIANGFSFIITGPGNTNLAAPTRLTHLKLEGTGCTGPTATPNPSSTFVPSSTPNQTSTFEPLWGSCLDFTADAFGFSAINATYNDVRGFVQSGPQWRIGRGGLATGAKKRVKLVFEAGQSFSGQIRLSDNVANFTSWKTASGNSVIVDFSVGEAWVPTSPFWVEFNSNNVPLALRQLCWLDPNPSTATPGPGTGTPLYTRTPLALTISPTYQPSRTPIVAPNPYIPITSTPGVIITTTPLWGGGYNPSTSIPPTAGTPGSGGGTDGNGLGDAGDMLGFAGEIGKGLLGAGGAYLGQVGDAAGGLLGAMTGSTPKPIGGLPMCMTNPMAHDICAIYYILDWTLFAPNTPGALIIPLIMILMNFFIVIRFVRFGLKLARRGESITSVD